MKYMNKIPNENAFIMIDLLRHISIISNGKMIINKMELSMMSKILDKSK